MDEDRLSIKELSEYTGADRARELEQRVRATLAPRPEHHYPAPWEVVDDELVVMDAGGVIVARAASSDAAEAIVLAVNTFAGVA